MSDTDRIRDLMDEISDYCAPLCAPQDTREAQAADYALQAVDVARELQVRLEAAEAALAHAQQVVREQQKAADDGDDDGEHVGIVRHRRAVLNGMVIVLDIWERSQETGQPRP